MNILYNIIFEASDDWDFVDFYCPLRSKYLGWVEWSCELVHIDLCTPITFTI